MIPESTIRTKVAEVGAGAAELAAGPWQVRVDVREHDGVGCVVDAIEVQRASPAPGSTADWARRLAEKSVGLLEPLRLLENDTQRGVAILRSAPPKPQDGEIRYYEAQLEGTERGRLQRYSAHAEPGQRREAVPFALTYEGLAKAVNDLTAER